MSYALRNTIVFLIALFLIGGGGFSYIYFFQVSEIEELEETLAERELEYSNKEAIAEQYPILQEQYDRSQEFVNNFEKTLFQKSDPDQVFKFLSELNVFWPRVEFNYNFNDSTIQDQYGIIRSTINGVGSYRSIYNFINRIENSMPIQKVSEITVTPINQPGEYGNANFNFELRSYYDRSDFFETEEEDFEIAMRMPETFHNPVFPLIREVEPNEDNLTNVESSRLIGVSGSRIYLRDQEGRLANLQVNDRVYLGRLEAIDASRGSATFRLNKGGIIEVVTLELQQ